MSRITRRRLIWITAALTLAIGLIAAEVVLTKSVREALHTFSGLIQAANRGKRNLAESLCTQRFLAAHPLKFADEGGLVGLPRTIHMNFQAWQEGEDVWICPTKGVGPVYRLVRDENVWKFDGMVGHRGKDGKIQAVDMELD